jgi:hypothetical protein
MTLNTTQTATALKTFNVLPQSAVVPVDPDDLVNKDYVDGLLASPTLQEVLDAGNSATGTMANITLIDTDVGGQVNPILNLQNTNATGSVALEVYKNKPTAGVAGDVLFNQSVYGKDTSNTKQEYTRISHTIRDGVSGGEDGSIEFSAFVNGAVNTFLQINGNENEINCLKNLDMTGNQIRTNTGDMLIQTTSSSGTGNLQIQAKGTASMSAPSIGLTATGTALNLQAPNPFSFVNITGYNGVTTVAITGDINTTTTSGDINTTATAGDVNITAGAILLLDSDDLRLTNSNVVTTTPNHTSSLATTSNIADITTYLKVKLNGADIWIPYFTVDPNV